MTTLSRTEIEPGVVQAEWWHHPAVCLVCQEFGFGRAAALYRLPPGLQDDGRAAHPDRYAHPCPSASTPSGHPPCLHRQCL
jgi:hypothetical protein